MLLGGDRSLPRPAAAVLPLVGVPVLGAPLTLGRPPPLLGGPVARLLLLLLDDDDADTVVDIDARVGI